MPLILCPNCNTEMKEITRNDVQIDMCPSCRGVWLDRGELEKLLDAVKEIRHDYDRPAPPRQNHEKQHDRDHDDDYYDKQKYDKYGKPRKKKSMFEMFDIFD